ncbi:MAG: HAMP domain-containing histidine kinase, partial [Muribaculaceae bacterium]|nr:HAMP domain-containing histidine kinase [Muribaculaceae bacterium]
GIVWVSSERGVEKHGYSPPLFYFNSLIINGFKRNFNDCLSSAGELDLSSGQNSVSLSFTALDYINGDDINYYYLLEGYTNHWVNLGTDPTVTFTNLPPGHYTLRVRYQSDSLGASGTEHSLGINVSAPWYATTWAYTAFALLLLLIVAGGIIQSRRIYQRKRRAMEHSLRIQQQKQLYADRAEFFTNITHELCSPLTMILGLCNILRKDLNETERRKLDHYIDSLQLHSRHLNDLVQEILDFRKVEEGGFRNIRVQPVKMDYAFDRWVNSYSEIARDNEITFRTSINPPDLKWNTDISCLGKIITNLTSNAFKYTPVKGEIDISVSVDEEDDCLLLSVYNTGAGISPDDQKDLFNRYKVFHNVD